jgi:hypothetical protein
MAINAFFFPLRADSFQNFTASRVFRDRDAAHAASQSAVLMWGFPWTVRVLFFTGAFVVARGNSCPGR